MRGVCLASETSILTFQRLNIKGVDQFVRIHKIVCTYVVGMQQSMDVIFCGRPILPLKAEMQTRMALGELAEMYNLDRFVYLI